MRKVFVISDLHLGGRPDAIDLEGRRITGFQFNHSYEALTDFVDWVSTVAKDPDADEVELVINGDIVDFLAEDDYNEALKGARIWTADEAEAVIKLGGIAQRTRGHRGRGVFDALKDFLTAGNRLTLLIGNHDVELSMPLIRRHLCEMLGGDTHRLKFIYDGEAYTLGRVLIEHGNRYDRWNMLDHSALRQERSMRSRHLAIDEAERQERYFVPPAGTYLVIHFINRIKSRYRFIDLLKPETNAMLPLLIALEPGMSKHLKQLLNASPVVRQYLKHGLNSPTTTKWSGDLGANLDDAADEVSLDRILTDTLGDDASLFKTARSARKTSGDMSINDDNSASPVMSRGEMGMLDKFRAIKEGMRTAGRWFATCFDQWSESYKSVSALIKMTSAQLPDERYRQLHAALKALNRDDRSFDPGHEDANYLQAARETMHSGNVDVVIYGHTHLPKKIRIDNGGLACWYLNTGTWCDVIRLPVCIAKDDDIARHAVMDFISALRKNDFDNYVRRYLSYVELHVDPQGKSPVEEPHLYSFCGAGRERSEPLTDTTAGGA
jgi:UDP-2,3-diacylglucosamine pyrophosphatase LpxH